MTTTPPTGDEVAIVGMAGRFPGAHDVGGLWRNLVAGFDAIHDYTDDELRELGIGDALLSDPRHVRSGGMLEPGVADFDADFFGFDPDEAATTDPQQRLFLETAWAALEDAGCDPHRERESVGVFAGTAVNRYFLFHLFDNPAVVGPLDPDDWESRMLVGATPDYVPMQVAYRLGLDGPAVAVQTGCSSSLVAVAMAAQNLVDYRCYLALAGGVSVLWPRFRSKPGGLASPDGRCRAFDAAAQGSGFSSGVAVVALKRLADAQRDGDHIWAVLRGWAVNNDGAARAGFETPGLAGQAAVVGEALASAGVAADDVGFVEAHGTGTLLGDAIEVTALTEAWRAAGSARRRDSCALGAVKTNLGHLDAASGVTGLIKAALTVHHGRVPGNLHYRRSNPEIDFPATPFFVPVSTHDWPDVTPRRAGVSSFGLGGTNTHVILEEPPARRRAHEGPAPAWYPVPLSARTPQTLAAAMARLRDHLVANPELVLGDVAHTLAIGRHAFAYRAVFVCQALDELIGGISRSRAAGGVTVVGDRSDEADRLEQLGRRWVLGADVDWRELGHANGGWKIPLPTYPFQRRRHWIDPSPRAPGASAVTASGGVRP